MTDCIHPLTHADLQEVESIQVGGPKVGGAYCTLCEVVVTSLDSSIQVIYKDKIR